MRSVLLFALFAANNTYTPTLPLGWLVAWLICSRRKEQAIGGWLLFFYWQLYSGILMTVVFFAINFQSYVPENFDHPTTYYLFLISAVPGILILGLQVAVGTMLLSVRTPDMLRLLRWLMGGGVIAAFIGTMIDFKYFPGNAGLGIFLTLLPEVLWLAYFLKSRRVHHVFEAGDWDIAVNSIYSTRPRVLG